MGTLFDLFSNEEAIESSAWERLAGSGMNGSKMVVLWQCTQAVPLRKADIFLLGHIWCRLRSHSIQHSARMVHTGRMAHSGSSTLDGSTTAHGCTVGAEVAAAVQTEVGMDHVGIALGLACDLQMQHTRL